MIVLSFFGYLQRPHLPSFPTRRSSDLSHSHTDAQQRVRKPETARFQHCAVTSFSLALPSQSTEEVRVNVVTLIGNLADRKSTRLNSSHLVISYAVFCLKKK